MTLRRLIPILLLAGLLPAGVGMSHAEGGDGSGAVSTDSLRTLIMEAKAASGDTITVAEADSILAQLADDPLHCTRCPNTAPVCLSCPTKTGLVPTILFSSAATLFITSPSSVKNM